ncbi:MAG: hypothetical protein ALECFALPRED_004734 [Alectoria fallacina]|uniref:Uncharacterized protein n=1 Tax=Alectoria fallacina TaxID=1903189 RepID=A0A8H3FTY1_9LECA|nr:MAG: hypothetical protein ALECFALPRED_004734 [Alectoria fallacina]
MWQVASIFDVQKLLPPLPTCFLESKSSLIKAIADSEIFAGSGKTVIFTQLIGRIQAPTPDATQTLILVHRRELVEQAARHCKNAYPSKSIEIEMGSSHASGAADITVASIWSIVSGDRMLKFDPKRFKLVLVDEAHHIVAAKFMETLSYFGLLLKDSTSAESPPPAALVGVSATLSRFDGLRLSDAIDHIVYHKDYVDMIGEKWLSNVIFTTVQSRADISGVKRGPAGDFQVGDLSRAINTSETNNITVRAWMARAAGRKSTLVFCVDLAHVSDLTATFGRHGIEAKFVTGDTPKRVRSERLDAFRNRQYPVLLNCGVFTEGTDIPNIDCVVLARPTKSRNLLVQMIGRGMRLYPGKDNCHIIDMVASLEVGIVTTPTLFGLDPGELVSGANIEEMKSQQKRKELEAILEERAANQATATSLPSRRSTITFTEYDSVYDLIDDTSGERHIRGISQLAWVMVGQNRYVLSTQNGDYLTIECSDVGSSTTFSVTYTQKVPERDRPREFKAKSPYMRPRVIASSETISDAVHAADTFALTKFPWTFVHNGQAWRKRPATEGQLAFINKVRPMADQLTADMISKGKATDMISKIKFGAKGWFSKLEAEKKRKERASEKVRQLDDVRQREQVRIGPVAQ